MKIGGSCKGMDSRNSGVLIRELLCLVDVLRYVCMNLMYMYPKKRSE
jgi:hypothetical protein